MKRHLLKLFVFLMLGAISTIAVAWSIALFLPMSGGNSYVDQVETQDGKSVVTWLWTDVGRSYAIQGVGYGPLGPITEHQRFCSVLPFGSLLRAGAPVLDRVAQEHAGILSSVNQRIVGWPLGSLSEIVYYDMQPGGACKTTRSGSFAPPDWVKSLAPLLNEPPQACVPSRPIWPGFTINTVLYAAMLWMLFAAPFALRRRRRIKHGLCPACAYPVWGGTSDKCTECGAAVVRKAVTA